MPSLLPAEPNRVRRQNQPDWVHDLVLPTLLFAALGGMTWAVRGSSGYGASAGCVFAGVLWGTAWWFIARDPARQQSRRYSSGWIVLALTVGVGISGARGWMQWPSFFEGKLQTNFARGEFVPISRMYGFVWLFIAGVPWAGVGACLLAWTASLRETRAWHWALRVACGIGGALLAKLLFDKYPGIFLPMYDSLEARYRDLEHNPNLRRLINDSGSAMLHLGLYLGLLLYELLRRDWKNVSLIATVGMVNGVGWALLQNWKWAPDVWSGANFNWWRCWESSAGVSIGIAYGLAYFLVNRPMPATEQSAWRARRVIEGPNLEWLLVFLGLASLMAVLMLEMGGAWGPWYVGVVMLFGVAYYLRRRGATESELTAAGDPNLERFGLYLGLLLGLGLSLRSGLKGWCNIYLGNEEYWSRLLWQVLGPLYLLILLAICGWILWRPLPRSFRGDLFPRAYGLTWLALVLQNVLAQLVTGPLSAWNEFAFSVYYALLFAISAVIIVHYQYVKRDRLRAAPQTG
ncbi:MAG: hypothetical protein K1X71_06375 [Pirellulales bacterium]|nr:hypothetical protein [Pirellulales bacterium]